MGIKNAANRSNWQRTRLAPLFPDFLPTPQREQHTMISTIVSVRWPRNTCAVSYTCKMLRKLVITVVSPRIKDGRVSCVAVTGLPHSHRLGSPDIRVGERRWRRWESRGVIRRRVVFTGSHSVTCTLFLHQSPHPRTILHTKLKGHTCSETEQRKGSGQSDVKIELE